MENKLIEGISYIRSSKNREKILLAIGENNIKIPSDISRETGIRLNYVSAILAELKKENILECLNENSKRGRLYRLTDIGNQIIKFIESK
jgi:DNA-binding MarR family transcriptional regulator